MAIEKMKMMNLAFLKRDAHDILQEIVLDGSVHITNASNSSNFTLRYISSQLENYKDMGVSISDVTPYKSEKIFKKKKYKDILDQVISFFDIKEEEVNFTTLREFSYNEKLKFLEAISKKMIDLKNREESNRYARSKLKALLKGVEYFEDSDLNISEFLNFKHIRMDIGEVGRNSWLNLKENYENIKAIVVHLGSNSFGEDIMMFTPKSLEEETKALLKSLTFEKIYLPNIDIKFKDLIEAKKNELIDLEKEQDNIKDEKLEFKKTYIQEVLSLYYRYKIIEKIEEIENHLAMGDNLVLFSAFVPESKTAHLKNVIEKISSNCMISFSDDKKISDRFKIPTKLKNNVIFRPFETLVNMYSVPDYNEADPTAFFAITYMLLFGMMFGDIGQGIVFILAGKFLSKKLGSLAKILQRIGVSSVIFGFLYGSVFGLEDIIPALVIRPMEGINNILLFSIALGVTLITIAYIINFHNLKLRKEYSNLYFDKNGIAGFAFYVSFLLLMLNITLISKNVSTNVASIITILSVAVMIITSTLMFMKPKLAQKIDGKNAHKEEFSPVESGFELFETVMGFFSNTLSFIRVGAFAINHVGLFMAFHALGQMIGTSFGNILMIIVGNIVILVLEGLIVFIQAIRLQYYELFSRYFKGEGVSYSPLHVDIKTKN